MEIQREEPTDVGPSEVKIDVPPQPTTATIATAPSVASNRNAIEMDLVGLSLTKMTKPLEISIQDISFRVEKVVKDGRGPLAKTHIESKQILHGITGTFQPGRLTCVMGASGAGKTSLLNVLAGEVDGRLVGGKMRVNGQDITPKQMKDLSAFVFQDDVILDTMTVKEAVTMSARLRLPTAIPLKEKEHRVEEVLKLMRLTKARDTIIGNPSVKGVSGGERKRTALSMEMVTNPSILFLDEPTSGLDTFTAYNVCDILRSLARTGRTIIATIHQPSAEIFYLFDDLCLLSEGRVAYFGPVKDVVGYFDKLGYTCPQYTNPADHLFMNVLNTNQSLGAKTLDVEKEKQRIQTLLDAWQACPQSAVIRQKAMNSEIKDGFDKTANKHISSFGNQFQYLMGRAAKNAIRNKFVLKVRFAQSLFISLLVGLVYLNVMGSGTTASVIQNTTGVLFLLSVNLTITATTGVLNAFGDEKTVFVREYSNGYYHLIPYFLSKSLVELPGQIVFPAIQAVIIYFMCGLSMLYWYQFPVFTLILILLSMCGTSLGIFFASVFPDVQVALAAFPIAFLPLLLFSGLFVNNGSIPPYFDWIKWLSPIKYGFESLAKNQFYGWTYTETLPNGAKVTTNGEQVISNLSLDDGLAVGTILGILLALYVFLFFAAMFALWRAVASKRK